MQQCHCPHSYKTWSHTDDDVNIDQCLYLCFTNVSRAETEQSLKEARERQVKDKEHFLAVQAARDRAEFERGLGVSISRFQLNTRSSLFHHFRDRRSYM